MPPGIHNFVNYASVGLFGESDIAEGMVCHFWVWVIRDYSFQLSRSLTLSLSEIIPSGGSPVEAHMVRNWNQNLLLIAMWVGLETDFPVQFIEMQTSQQLDCNIMRYLEPETHG